MDVFDLAAKLTLDSSEYDKGLSDAEGKAGGWGSKVAKGFGTAGKVAGATFTAIVAGTTAAAAGVAKATGEVAEYGDNIDKMSQKLGLSSEAYQKWDYVLGQAGTDISSMSTGLKTLTNKLDEAKNGSSTAAAMFEQLGISMEELQTMSREDVFEAAIYGFQGMADSTERAALANDLFGRSGQELTPLFNSTIEETQALMQAAEDLGFVMSDESVKAAADYQDALDTLQRTSDGLKRSFVAELMPGITGVTEGLTSLFSGDYDAGGEQIAAGIDNVISSITDNLPKIMEAGFAIISGLADALVENFPKLVDTFLGLIDTLLNKITENGGEMVSKIGDMLVKTIQAISQKLPDIIKSIGPVIITVMTTLLKEVLPALIQAIFDMLPDLLQSILDLIVQLVDFILSDGLPMIIEMLPQIITGIIDFILTAIPQLIQAVISIVMAIVDAIPTIIQSLIKAIPQIITGIITAILSNIPQLIQAGIQLFISLIAALPQIIIEVVKAIPEIITGLVNGFKEAWPQIKEAGTSLLGSLMEGLVNIGSKIKDAATKVWEAIKNAFTSFVDKIKEIGKNIIQGLIDGIKSMIGKVGEVVKGIGEKISGGFKKLFGIASPSKVFAEYGRFLDEGLAIGISTNLKPIDDAMDEMYNEVEGFSPRITPQLAPAGAGGPGLQFEGSNTVISQLALSFYLGTERLQTMIIDATNLAQYEAGGR